MFTHGKRPLSLWLGRLTAAGMLLALLVFMCSLRSPAVEVSAAEREEETVLDSREEVFVTTSATLTSRSGGDVPGGGGGGDPLRGRPADS